MDEPIFLIRQKKYLGETAVISMRIPKDMLADIEIMSEKDFTEKYTAIAENLVKQMEEEREEEENRIAEAKANGTDIREVLKDFPWNVEREWYNNTVWDILTLFDKRNMFAD